MFVNVGEETRTQRAHHVFYDLASTAHSWDPKSYFLFLFLFLFMAFLHVAMLLLLLLLLLLLSAELFEPDRHLNELR